MIDQEQLAHLNLVNKLIHRRVLWNSWLKKSFDDINYHNNNNNNNNNNNIYLKAKKIKIDLNLTYKILCNKHCNK